MQTINTSIATKRASEMTREELDAAIAALIVRKRQKTMRPSRGG